MVRKTERLLASVLRFVGSNFFFKVVIALAILQGLWYALSFQPSMYDEARHFSFTKIYTSTADPFIEEQDRSWDAVGETTREPSYLFYYIMSWPLRFIGMFSENEALQLVGLRIICIIFFVGGLILFRRLFRKIKISDTVTNFALLFFILTPGVAILPGVYNYDNLIILLTPLLLILAVDIIRSKRINPIHVSFFLALGLIGSEIKFTFIALYAPVFIFVAYRLSKAHGRHLLNRIVKAYARLSKTMLVWVLLILAVSGLLFAERVGVNLIKYHSPTPGCVEVLNVDRCKTNDITKRNLDNEAHRKAMGEAFNPIGIYHYFMTLWAPTIIRHHASPNHVLPVMSVVFNTYFIVGLGLLLMYIRGFFKKPEYAVLILASFVYVGVILLYNYSIYLKQAAPVAMNGRYLFPILPVFTVLLTLSFISMARRSRLVLGSLLTTLLILMTQGGGITTYILDNYEPIYWKESPMYQINANAKALLQPVIKG